MNIHPLKYDEKGQVQQQKKKILDPLDEAKHAPLVDKTDNTLQSMVEVLREELRNTQTKLEATKIEELRLQQLLKKNGVAY